MNEVVWSNPRALWLLWSLPVLALFAVRSHHRVRRAAEAFAGTVMTPRLMPPLGAAGAARRTLLLLAGVALVIVAAARPGFGVYYLPTSARGLDLAVVLDVSRSMLADDGGDSRLGRARSAIGWLADELRGDRIGLLLFAGTTVQACPLTLDRGYFRTVLAAAGPGAVGRGGTRIGPALDEALRMLDTSWDRDKLVLLVTDGGDQESFPKSAAERLREKGVRVIALGLGSADAGAPLVLDGQVVRRADGQPVSARLHDELLRDLATATDGMYVPPDAAHRLPELYAEHFADLRRGENQEVQEKHHREQFQWFLAAGLLLLLVQAGLPTYPRRRRPAAATGAARAAALAAVLALPFLAGCSPAGGTVDLAIAKLEAGEAEAAERLLLDLATGDDPDPVLVYDLACAHQARGRAREARLRYADVLARGDRRLRARAHVNLAMLAVERLRDTAGDEPYDLAPDRRAEVRELAEAALADLARARRLDAGMPGLTGRQDALARWLRVVEDGWAAHDRQAEKDARAALRGPAFLAAWLTAERGLVERLAAGELLEDVELRQRDLADELPGVAERFGDDGEALAEVFRAEVGAAVDAARPALEAVTGLLREARTDDAVPAIAAVADDLTAAWVLWADPGAALGAAAREQRAFAGALQAVAVARDRSAGERSDPEAGDAAGGADLAILERARDDLAAREGRLVRIVENLGRRCDPEHADAAWPVPFVERARTELPEVATLERRVVERIGGRGPQALLAAARAAQKLEALALEWQLAGLDAPALARRLEAEQLRLVRAADGLRDDAAPASGVVGSLERLAGGLARTLGWLPVRDGQRDQVRRLGYLEEAARRAADAPAAGTAPDGGGAPPPDPEARQRSAELAARLPAVREAVAAAERATEAGAGAATVDAMHGARVALRDLADALAGFEELLALAAGEQDALAARAEALAAGDAGDAQEPDAQDGLAGRHRDQRREQVVTTARISGLDHGLDAEIAARAAVVERSATAPDAGAPAAGPPDAAARAEEEARLAVLRELGDLLGPAAAAAGEADAALGTDTPAEPDAVRGRFRAAAPPARRAADLLADARRRLAEARLSLAELAERLVDGEAGLLHAARELAAGRDAQLATGEPLDPERLRRAAAEAGSFVARLGPALERQLAAAASPAPAAPAVPAPAPSPEVEAELRSLVAAVEQAHAASVEALGADDRARWVPAIAAALDAARALWLPLAELRPLLERAVAEQASHVATSEELKAAGDAVAADRVASAAEDQTRTAALPPAVLAKVEALAAAGAAAPPAPPAGDPSAPDATAPPAAGLPPEVVALARDNLPAAEAAMQAAATHAGARAWNDALDRQEEAHRLLRELLDKLREAQDRQEPQDRPQDQPQDRGESPPDGGAAPQARLSPAELERLLQAVRERNDRKPRPAARTPVQEDW